MQLAHGDGQAGASRRRFRRKRVAEQGACTFGNLDFVVGKHGDHDLVIAADLDEGDALADQARDHVGEHLIAPGDEDRAVGAEIALQQSVGLVARHLADRTLGPDVNVEQGRVGGGGERRLDQIGVALLDGVGEAEGELAFAGTDSAVVRCRLDGEQAGTLFGIGKLVPRHLVEKTGILRRHLGLVDVDGGALAGCRFGDAADRIFIGPLDGVLDRVAGADDHQHLVVVEVELVGGAGADDRRIVLPETADIGEIGKTARLVLVDEAGIFAGGVDDGPFRISKKGRFLRPLVAGDISTDLVGQRLRRGTLSDARQWRCVQRRRREKAVGQPGNRDQHDNDDEPEDRLDDALQPAEQEHGRSGRGEMVVHTFR
ncbi:hypothetical protein NKH98_25220 [Mesorhizobium sp. M0833]|uniref:hypothetical protein n=1 Tax=Mesorhizobium sp. M0833 TaxID=2957009 RepID=UPI00333AA75F